MFASQKERQNIAFINKKKTNVNCQVHHFESRSAYLTYDPNNPRLVSANGQKLFFYKKSKYIYD